MFGVLQGTITDAGNSNAIEGARIFIFNADTKTPTGAFSTSDVSGNYEFKLTPGNYFIKVYKQGYFDVTPKDIPAIPFTISLEDTLSKSVEMYTHNLTDGGWISGNVSSTSGNNIGVLVVANDTSSGYSSITDSAGNYIIYNVPAGDYDVKAWGAGFNSSTATASVTASTETANVDLVLTDGASGSVSGSITFLSTTNIEVDVALTHEITGEAIPGLSATTVGQQYTISNVPDGTFLARASFINDGKVMDPDWIIKNGEPFVTVSGGAATRDFSVTGAITVTDPTNAASSSVPVEISTTTPTFTWEAYSSTSDYIVEVRDANGKLIWGGFSDNWTTRNMTVPSSQTSVAFNSDGNAIENLKVGQTYRWRVYASKDAQGGASWNLISASEDQMGLFTIIQ